MNQIIGRSVKVFTERDRPEVHDPYQGRTELRFAWSKKFNEQWHKFDISAF